MKPIAIIIILLISIPQAITQKIEWNARIIKDNSVKKVIVFGGSSINTSSDFLFKDTLMLYAFDNNGNVSELTDYYELMGKTHYYYSENLKLNLETTHFGNFLRDSIVYTYYEEFYIEKHYDLGYQMKLNPMEIIIVSIDSNGFKNKTLRLYGTFKHWLTLSDYRYIPNGKNSIITIKRLDYEDINWLNLINNCPEEKWIELIDTLLNVSKSKNYKSIETDSIFYNEDGLIYKAKNDFQRTDKYFIWYNYEDCNYSESGLIDKLMYRKKSGFETVSKIGSFIFKYEFKK